MGAVSDMLTKDKIRYGLNGLEFAGRIFVTNELLSMGNGCPTLTMEVLG